MTFEDLPDDWPTRPVTDPTIFDDVVDLVVTDRDRLRGAVYVLLCDPEAHLLQPCAVCADADLPDPAALDDADRRRLVQPFAKGLAGVHPDGGLVIVAARRGFRRPTESDLRWAEAAAAVCSEQGLSLFAAAVATPFGVLRLSHPVASR